MSNRNSHVASMEGTPSFDRFHVQIMFILLTFPWKTKPKYWKSLPASLKSLKCNVHPLPHTSCQHWLLRGFSVKSPWLRAPGHPRNYTENDIFFFFWSTKVSLSAEKKSRPLILERGCRNCLLPVEVAILYKSKLLPSLAFPAVPTILGDPTVMGGSNLQTSCDAVLYL